MRTSLSSPVDFCRGPNSLLTLVRDAGSDPFNGALSVFRGAKRAARVKIAWWDGSGSCLSRRGWINRSSAGPASVITGFSSTIPSFWRS
ncbi:IS66 family insertion sequence element accessory protein TnpB [Sinorhizobium sp. GL28]|uniref:IS66 family insertion sequence element accessory protein TnpB n=1 Tax=Sinorhizobium sp. GL28 TaxID=1358418 RepID=UPI0012E39283